MSVSQLIEQTVNEIRRGSDAAKVFHEQMVKFDLPLNSDGAIAESPDGVSRVKFSVFIPGEE